MVRISVLLLVFSLFGCGSNSEKSKENEKENAVADFRELIGATDPAKAEEGTIRKKFASSMGENAVHGSDSDENAEIEGSFFFSSLEKF